MKCDVLCNRSNTTNEHEEFDLLIEKREQLIGRILFVETFDEPGLSQHPETGCHRLGQGQISAGSHLLLHDRALRGIARPGEKQKISFLPFFAYKPFKQDLANAKSTYHFRIVSLFRGLFVL